VSKQDRPGDRAQQLDLHIAIDGPAGAGKSTVGQGIARALGCPYLDTGLMYRAVTWEALQEGVALSDSADLTEIARNLAFALQDEPLARLLIDAQPAADVLHTPAVDEAVSEVSAHANVRAEMVRRQRELAADRCVVMVGRDIGSTVLPDAPIKIWITASVQERAQRRMEERFDGASDLSADDVLNEIMERDRRDSSRVASPQRKPDDAIVIETDGLRPEETLGKAVSAVQEAIDRLPTKV
jgi:cytidylate kinase